MTRIALQLITVRDLDEPFGDTLDWIAEAGYDGVQLRNSMPDRLGMTPEAIRKAIHTRDLAVVAPFVSDPDHKFEHTVATLETYGATMACHGFSSGRFDSVDAVETAAADFDRIAGRLSERGVTLCYHNHDHEFVQFGSQTAYDILLKGTTRAEFILDIGWAFAGGVDPTALLEQMGERVPLVHMKDYDRDRGAIVELGEGGVDVEGCTRVARDHDAEWLIYEHDHPDDPLGTIHRGAEFLRSL